MDDPRIEALRHKLEQLWVRRSHIARHSSPEASKEYQEMTAQLVRLLVAIEAIEDQEAKERQRLEDDA